MNITQAPHGINLVVETDRIVYIGRLGKTEGNQVKLHHAAAFQAAANSEDLIRRAARFGVPVEHEMLSIEAQGIRRIRRLGDVPKA
jgi:hypothetical protein